MTYSPLRNASVKERVKSNEYGPCDCGTTDVAFVISSPSPLLTCGDMMKHLLQSKHRHSSAAMHVWKLLQSSVIFGNQKRVEHT